MPNAGHSQGSPSSETVPPKMIITSLRDAESDTQIDGNSGHLEFITVCIIYITGNIYIVHSLLCAGRWGTMVEQKSFCPPQAAYC